MPDSKFTVGQTVMLGYRNGRAVPTETVVTKVGRKYAYVAQFSEPFDRETGREARPGSGYAAQIWTLDEWAENRRRDELVRALADLGIRVQPRRPADDLPSIVVLERMLDVMRHPRQDGIVALLLDDEDSVEVHGLYRTEEGARVALRQHCVSRWGEDEVRTAEAESDGDPTGGAISWKLTTFDWPPGV